MLTLCFRTDKPKSELYLYNDSECLGLLRWEAHRALADTIHAKLNELLTENGKDMSEIGKVVVLEGPGSFTGLRIGISVANALAYGLNIPIVGSSGKQWIQIGLDTIGDMTPIQPVYGREAHITQPRK